jgi:hypothetical protein
MCAAGEDGFGARVIFKRELDRRFKGADMMYQGALEY